MRHASRRFRALVWDRLLQVGGYNSIVWRPPSVSAVNIAERIGLGRISRLGLVHYDPQTDITLDDIDSVCGDGDFAMRFVAKLLPVELRHAKIPPLLQR